MKLAGHTYALLVQKGKRYMPQAAAYKTLLDKLPDGEYMIFVKKRYKRRSVEQNNYYWLVMQFVADELGYDDAEEVHSAMKIKFLLGRDKKLLYTKSTADLDTVGMKDYMDKCFRYIEDPVEGLGIKVPDPDEMYTLNH